MDGLYSALMHGVTSALQRECADNGSINRAAKDSIYQPGSGGVYTYMYDLYDPTVYERRYDAGGLGDERNLETVGVSSSGNSVTIHFEEKTRENGPPGFIPDPAFYVSDIVESGSYGPKWKSILYYTQYARPYLEQSLTDGATGGNVIDRAIENAMANLQIRW